MGVRDILGGLGLIALAACSASNPKGPMILDRNEAHEQILALRDNHSINDVVSITDDSVFTYHPLYLPLDFEMGFNIFDKTQDKTKSGYGVSIYNNQGELVIKRQVTYEQDRLRITPEDIEGFRSGVYALVVSLPEGKAKKNKKQRELEIFYFIRSEYWDEVEGILEFISTADFDG